MHMHLMTFWVRSFDPSVCACNLLLKLKVTGYHGVMMGLRYALEVSVLKVLLNTINTIRTSRYCDATMGDAGAQARLLLPYLG